jgi:hypothetical protein
VWTIHNYEMLSGVNASGQGVGMRFTEMTQLSANVIDVFGLTEDLVAGGGGGAGRLDGGRRRPGVGQRRLWAGGTAGGAVMASEGAGRRRHLGRGAPAQPRGRSTRAAAHNRITTLPKWAPLSRYLYAACASANGKTRSTTGLSLCRAMARFMASNMAREPT